MNNQKAHHYENHENYLEAVQQLTFEAEYIRLLDSFGMAYDPAYVFELPPVQTEKAPDVVRCLSVG